MNTQTAIQLKEKQWDVLYNAVKDASSNTFYTFDELNRITGKNTRGSRGMIYKVNKLLLKNEKKMLLNVKNAGYKIGFPEEQMRHGVGRNVRAKRHLDKGTLELTNIDTTSMSEEEKTRMVHMLNRYQSALTIIRKKNVESLNLTKKAVVSQEHAITTLDDIMSRIKNIENKMAV